MRVLGSIVKILLLVACISACSAPDGNLSSLSSDSLTDSYSIAALKFSQRDQNLFQLLDARKYSQQILDGNTKSWDNSDQWLGIAQLHMRTFEYEANHYYPDSTQKEDRRRIYSDAIASVEKYLSPAVLGYEHASYFYFKALFYLGLSDNVTFIEQLNNLKILNETFDKGFNAFGSGSLYYEGGGLYRLKALLKSKDYYQNFPQNWQPLIDCNAFAMV